MLKPMVETMNDFLKYQTTSMSGVKAEYKNRVEGDKLVSYINSPAGLIIYKTKSHHEMANFRNDVVNKVSNLIATEAKEKEYFKLTKYVREKYKVEYKANIHTRLKSLYVL